MPALCVFCGSRSGLSPSYVEAAAAIGHWVATHQVDLVYGGGSTGMMGAIADATLQAGGTVIGVIPESLATTELMHPGVADMRIVADMHERKAMMHSLSDAYLALPGGLGTMEELFESLCWAQLKFHESPIAALNSEGLYTPLFQLLTTMCEQGFVSLEHLKLLAELQTVQQVESWLRVVFRV